MDALAVPTAASKGPTKPGLIARLLQVSVPWSIDDQGLTPSATATMPTPEVAIAAKNKGNAVVLQGWLKMPEDGVYRFSLPTSSRGVMKLHGSPVIDADRGDETNGEIRLDTGFHPILISFRIEGDAEVCFVLSWSKDGGEMISLTTEAFVTAE